ncbi:MAG: hypothetical protein AVDCRST_MAG08-4193, partial [uncultured Acetobacteraceae bacterium]
RRRPAGPRASAAPRWPAAAGAALVWALTAPYLPPAGHLFMALTILPIYGLPPLVAALSMRQAKFGARREGSALGGGGSPPRV